MYQPRHAARDDELGTLIIVPPDLEWSLHTSLLELVWADPVYIIASTVLAPVSGRSVGSVGTQEGLIGGSFLVAVASLGAASWSRGRSLILWWILQDGWSFRPPSLPRS